MEYWEDRRKDGMVEEWKTADCGLWPVDCRLWTAD